MLPARFQRLKPEEQNTISTGFPSGPALETARALLRLLVRLENNVGEVLDALRERVLSGGLTRVEHMRGRLVSAVVTIPSEWEPLTLANGATAWDPANPPSVRWASGWWETRNLVGIPAGFAVGYTLPFATFPGLVVGGNREISTVASAQFAVLTAYGAPSGIYFIAGQPSPLPGVVWLSLNGVRFKAPEAPPDWGTPVEVPIPTDYPGEVDTVEVVGARDVTLDGGIGTSTPGVSGAAITWEIVPRNSGRVLRIRRMDGLTPGSTYQLDLWLAAK